MNYFGRLVSNVRGFYSEINSATLTGAIDVVVIRQEDGSFMGSPFHVRFGKLGVLRSREKIVDIEINGEPVSLQMKLGDAGEAFFVEEVEETVEIPSDMATTPIPSLSQLSNEIVEKNEKEDEDKLSTEDIDNTKEAESEETNPPEGKDLAAKPSDTQTEEKKIANEGRSDQGTSSQENTQLESTEVMEDDQNDDKTSLKNVEETNTTIEGNAVKSEAQDGYHSDPETGEETVCQPIHLTITETTDMKEDDIKGNQKEDDINADVMEDDIKENIKEDDIMEDLKEGYIKADVKEDEIKADLKEDNIKADLKEDEIKADLKEDEVKADLKEDEIKADLKEDEIKEEANAKDLVGCEVKDPPQEEDVGPHLVSESIPIPGTDREVFSDSDSSNWMMDSTSLPDETDFRRNHLIYPLSDLDSPIGSPSDYSGLERMHPSNPMHCLSDTEIEIQHSLQGNITGRNEVTWDWGKLPKGPEGMYPHDRKINVAELKREDPGYIYRTKRKDLHVPKSHKIKEEGIYLDDLTSVDDEIARLYLNQALKSREHYAATEDRESGLGQSLPSSPSTEESALKDASSDTYHDIAMSLCGDLKNGKVSLESFMKYMVSYEDLSSNPTLLSNPKLVIRINDRYFNWQIAAPMLMSYIIFQRPLQQETVGTLVKQHMPKKEKRRSYYWFSWRQNYEEQSSDEDEDDLKKEKHRPRVHSSGRKQLTTTPTDAFLDQDQDLDPDQDIGEQQRQRNVSECTSGNESELVNYRKSTRLTSEELSKLNLQDGANSAMFSVTTKYQGTAACQATIYLWNYDDRIIISDIDGTITKSDVLGHILPVVGQAWAQSGVAHFFSSIQKNDYKLLYLSARAIGQAQLTRDYLKSVKQDQITLPDGPLLLSPASLIKAFHRELIEKKPEEFKISALRDILSLFPAGKKPFYSGFGNKVNDVYSYRAVGVSLSRIFTINHKGEVTNELTTTFQSSYMKLSDLVDQMFPPYKKEDSMRPSGLVAPDEFSSFTYWRNPLPEIDIEGFEESTEETTETIPPN